MEWDILPVISFSIINSKSISINNSNFFSTVFKASCPANLSTGKNFAGSKF